MYSLSSEVSGKLHECIHDISPMTCWLNKDSVSIPVLLCYSPLSWPENLSLLWSKCNARKNCIAREVFKNLKKNQIKLLNHTKICIN